MKASDQLSLTNRGKFAKKPSELPGAAWKQILRRVKERFAEDRILLVSAGAAFYLLLSLLPALSAFFSIYALFTSQEAISDHFAKISGMLPVAVVEAVQDQIQAFIRRNRGSLSIGIISGGVIAFWGANKGVKTIFEALNIAYRERETRSFVKLNLTAMLFTLATILSANLTLGVLVVIPTTTHRGGLPLGLLVLFGTEALRWLAVALVAGSGITLLYRFGPDRKSAKWRWITWGSIGATLSWLIISASLVYYLRNFSNYDMIYGSLGAVIGFMVWIWITVTTVILGAVLNAEMEHQTSTDTTIGPPQPIGSRGAKVADTAADE
jgi:membrane protein